MSLKREFVLIIIFSLLTLGTFSQTVNATPLISIKVSINIDVNSEGDEHSCADRFYEALDYSWIVGSQKYQFNAEYTDITLLLNEYNQELNTYDVHMETGIQQTQTIDGAYQFSPLLAFYYDETGKRHYVDPNEFNKNLKEYVEDGHGYVGHCSSAGYAVTLSQNANTLLEDMADKVAFLDLDDDIKEKSYIGFPIVDEHLKWVFRENKIPIPFPRMPSEPELIGHPAFFEYMSQNHNLDQYLLCGFPTDLILLDHSHPIFKDYLEDTWRVRYGGGMSFDVDDDATYVSKLTSYPSNANSNIKFVAWTFPFMITRIPKLLLPNYDTLTLSRIKAAYLGQYLADGDVQRVTTAYNQFPCDPTDCGGLLSQTDSQGGWFYNLTGWRQYPRLGTPVDIKYIDPHLDNNFSMLAFNYPEGASDGGRVFLSGCHPELSDWDTTQNYYHDSADASGTKWRELSMYNGLEFWKEDIGIPGYTGDDRLMTLSDTRQLGNAWFIQREAAWASKKVPDAELPPVYGRSQVVDIDPLLQQGPAVLLKCCVGKYDNEAWYSENLSLYYRYKGPNSNYQWTSWTRYSSTHQIPYQFQFDSSLSLGNGQYEFYSLFNTSGISAVNESSPPGADASCYIGGDIYADYTRDINLPYVNQTVQFTSQSITKEGTQIIQYSWSFGDGRTAIGGDPEIALEYTRPGTYIANLTVTNNLYQQDTARINITVLNNPPLASFNFNNNTLVTNPNYKVAQVNTPINLYDTSIDPDGAIVNRSWDFGDNTTSYDQNPSHVYTMSGYYQITLHVTDNDDGIDTATDIILIYDSIANASIPSDIPANNTWRTIQKAIDNTTTGGIVYVVNGNYSEDIHIPTSLTLIGTNRINTTINGRVTMTAPTDYELPSLDTGEWLLFMNGTNLLMHFNNETAFGEDYGNSPKIYDYSENKNNGTINGATWTTDTIKGAGCFSFDGINDIITLPAIPALTKSNVTVQAWIYWDDHETHSNNPILSQIRVPGEGFNLYINDEGKPVFQLNTSETISTEALTTGWHYIVGTHNQSTLSIIVDGECKSTRAATGNGSMTRGYIGFDNKSYYFQGKIDEVAIWNRTLVVEEIKALYQENYGIYFEGFTIQNGQEYGISPCDNTRISDCSIINTSTAILLNNKSCVRISDCNITNCDIGVLINDSSPSQFNRIRIVDCIVDQVNHGIYINNSENASILSTTINGSLDNLTFNGVQYYSLFVVNSNSPHNEPPSQPIITGATLGDPGKSYEYTALSNDSNGDQISYQFDWDDGNISQWQNFSEPNIIVKQSHTWTQEGGYFVRIMARDIFNNESDLGTLLFRTETLPPIIHSVTATPHTVGFGSNISISANITDNMTSNWSGINTVKVNITYPDSSFGNYTMNETTDNNYSYVFNDTWLNGRYNYTIWAIDNAYNVCNSSGHHFHVSATATISIATLKNSYSGTQYINITDPPNPPENLTVVDRGLTWNTYYNATSGENLLETYQGPVNYQEENNTWMPINNTITQLPSNHPAYVYGYRNGNDHGLYGVYFKSNVQQEWPVAFTYNKSEDPTVYTVRSKLVGVGYVDPQSNWAYQYLQNVQNSQGQTNDYSITYPGVFTGTDVTWSYGNIGLKEEITMNNATKTILQNHPPSQYGLNDTSSYLVFITKLDYQNLNLYNGSGLLAGNVTISDTGVDFKDILGQFKCALPLGEAYELNNETARQKLTYRIIHLSGDSYLLSGLKVNKLNTMTFPVVIDPTLTVYSTSNDGHIYKSGSTYSTVQGASTGTINNSGTYITIGQWKTGFPATYNIYRGFVYFNTSAIPSNAYLDNATLSLYKKDDYSTTDFDITIQNGQPTYPHNPMQTGDYFRNYYSGNGGTLGTSRFTSGYNAITMSNLNWINKTGITKLCLRSSRDISGTAPTGSEYVNVHSSEFLGMCPPKLVINYRNQSKIKNTGTSDIKGYLLIQVQFYDLGKGIAPHWIVDNDSVNETTQRTINSGSQLALDTIFNGHVRASDLTHGTGTYRVYAAFRDPEGNILRTNDDVDLEA